MPFVASIGAPVGGGTALTRQSYRHQLPVYKLGRGLKLYSVVRAGFVRSVAALPAQCRLGERKLAISVGPRLV